ncbi:hypothetical protein AB0J83_23410, partial [Actinoplanes sp. NPDC049596]
APFAGAQPVPRQAAAPVTAAPTPRTNPTSPNVRFSPGAASVPGAAPLTSTRVFDPSPTGSVPSETASFPTAPTEPVPHRTASFATASMPPGPSAPGASAPGYGGVAFNGTESPRKSRRALAVTGAFVAALLAAGAGVFFVLNQDDDGDKNTATPPAGAPAKLQTVAYPTDKKILVRVDTGAMSGFQRTSKIYSFQPGADTPRTLLAGTQPGDVLPKWSHDRKRIALTHNTAGSPTSEIFVMNADGSERRKLIGGVTGGRVTWSGDDQKLAFVKKVGTVNQIFTVPVDGGAPTQITFARDGKDDPFWSTDGSTITYWVERGGVRQIFELDAAAPKEPGRQITTPEMGETNDPAPSPDGERILYTREVDQDNSDIWIVDRDGSNNRRLTTDPAREMDPSWSPDGSWFALVRGPYERPAIVLLKPDGTGETVLTKPGQREAHPCWF